MASEKVAVTTRFVRRRRSPGTKFDTPRLLLEFGHHIRFQGDFLPFWQGATFSCHMANLAPQPAGNGRCTSTFLPPTAEAVAESPQLLPAAALQHASERAGSRMCALAPVRRQAAGSSSQRRPFRRRSEASPPAPQPRIPFAQPGACAQLPTVCADEVERNRSRSLQA